MHKKHLINYSISQDKISHQTRNRRGFLQLDTGHLQNPTASNVLSSGNDGEKGVNIHRTQHHLRKD